MRNRHLLNDFDIIGKSHYLPQNPFFEIKCGPMIATPMIGAELACIERFTGGMLAYSRESSSE